MIIQQPKNQHFSSSIVLPEDGDNARAFLVYNNYRSILRWNRSDFFAIAIGSSTQIAVFVAPLMVLIAWALGVPLTFEFGKLETVSVFLAVMIANLIAADGKSNWLEGAMLLGAYIILGAAFLFHP